MFRSLFGLISTVTVVALLGLAVWSSYEVVALNRADIYDENGLLENIQVALLVIAGIAFLAPIAFEQRTDKLILLFCSVFCFSIMLRELEIQHLDIPDAIKFIASRRGRNIAIGISIIAIFSYAAFWFSYYKNAAIKFVRSRPAVLLMAGGVFLLIGDAFEKNDWIIYHVYFEEMSEVIGYVFMLLAAFSANSFVSRLRGSRKRKE